MPEFNMCEILSEATKLTPRTRESAFLYSRRLIKELAADEFPADDWDTLPDEAQQWVNQQIRATNENKQVEEVPGFQEYTERNQRFNKAGNGEEVKPTRVQRVRAVAAPPEEIEPEEEDEEPPPPPVRAKAVPVARAKVAAPVVAPVEEDEIDEEEDEPVPVKAKVGRPAKAKAPEVAKEEKEKGPRAYMTRKRPDGKPSAIIRIKEYLITEGHLTPNQIMQKLEHEGYTVSQTTVVSCKADFRATLSLLQDKGLLTQQML
jgi:hypothetical protein